jgi:Mrp family chromosome partitioning ATPase
VEENRTTLAKVVESHRTEYDLILLDNGSVTESPLSEFYEFWNRTKLDGVVLVANPKHPSAVPVSHIAERLRQHGIHLIGITENCV